MVSLYVGVFEFSYRIETQNIEVIGTSHCLCNGSVIAWHLQKTIMYAAENGDKAEGHEFTIHKARVGHWRNGHISVIG